MVRIIFISIASFICWNTFSQGYNNNFVFGDSVGLNFSTDPPTFFKTSINSHEACASISDTLGNLLFYTNGQNVWNKEHEIMPNGSDLEVADLSGTDPSSTTQGVIIIPRPLNLNEYFIFQSQTTDGLKYSVVNLSMYGGMGDVTDKNISISDLEFNEKMNAVKHANGRDWWLILCNLPDNDGSDTSINFIKYLINPFTIDGPFTQAFGPSYDGISGYAGQLKFSKDGSKLCYTRGKFTDIYDFDRCTGEISNGQIITVLDSDDGVGSYGCEFSADGRLLYIATVPNSASGGLYQFCLTCAEPINDTKVLIYENIYNNYMLSQLQIGPNNKIYLNIFHYIYSYYIYSVINTSTNVINDPNVEGIECNFDTSSISLEDSRCTANMPNMPNYNLGVLEGSGCDTLDVAINTPAIQNEITIYPNPAIDHFFINFTTNNLKNCEVSITDAVGKNAITQIISSNNMKINVAALSKGIYFVSIRQDGEIIFTNSFVKQ